MTPVDAVLPELRAALEGRTEAVLVAAPGAGKTTRAPPGLLDASWAKTGKLILLSPRRIAARAAAARMAAERGERVGETVGYRVRLDSKVGPKTRIEVVTEGVFTRMILGDPELGGVACVIFDEFHERSLEGDLGLALARDAQAGLRPDLRILVMSATLDAARVSALLGDAPVIVSEGRMHPVETRYRPRDARAPLDREAAAAVRFAMASDPGSALVFLPGAREIERTAEQLRGMLAPDIDVRPLYGAMSPQDQDAAIAPAAAGKRKAVLATSIAETSLTIEGVRIVIDIGLTRRPRYEPALGLSRLETVRASQASVEQRRGRAGRTEPGVCWRLWSEGETRALPAFDRPEILEADLSGFVLDLASWGVRDPAALAWLDPPPKPSWNEAVALLKRLGALDDAGVLTPHGAALAKLPLPPRLAHMVAAAPSELNLTAGYLAVLLTEQGLGGRDIDLRVRLGNLLSDRGERGRAARALGKRLAGGGEGVEMDRVGEVLALGFSERVAKARDVMRTGARKQTFLLVNGRAAAVNDDDALARETFIVVADATGGGDDARVLAAVAIGQAEIERLFAKDIETAVAANVDRASGVVRARRVRRIGRMVLSETPLERAAGDEMTSALLDAVREEGLSLLDWDETAQQTQARVLFMRGLDGEAWPDWSSAALQESVALWLAPVLDGVSSLKAVDVSTTLLRTLPYELKRKLDADAPSHFDTPAGSSLRIDYSSAGGPALDVRLQELFGLDKHPSVAGGRVPLSLRLLSPAHRPVQTTKDLPGFWRGSYASVRADMRGRYPKHPWPEDPLTAPPTRRAKPKGT